MAEPGRSSQGDIAASPFGISITICRFVLGSDDCCGDGGVLWVMRLLRRGLELDVLAVRKGSWRMAWE